MTDEVWDYLFRDMPFPENAPITREQGEALRREFTYFYPLDIRSSGKDLIPNHLTFCVYVHAALFPEKYWPRSMRGNGHLLLNSTKMVMSFFPAFDAACSRDLKSNMGGHSPSRRAIS
jgi:leucyl-tRNA synthetase